ncbi:MAG: ABC transporter permease subunit [Nitrospirota bacterium]|nr:ABC transporter permease subunit [Nitrospirota bacterium]
MADVVKDQEARLLLLPQPSRRPETTARQPAPRRRAPLPVSIHTIWLRPFLDRLAKRIISLGGIAVIASILAMLAFLVMEVAPLFLPATARPIAQTSLAKPPAADEPALIGLDEHRNLAYVIKQDGIVFLELESGRVMPVELPPALQGKRITAMAQSGNPLSGHMVGTADGLVIPIKIAITTVRLESGARAKQPSIAAATPIKLADVPITALAYRAGDHGSGIAAVTESGELALIRLGSESDEHGSEAGLSRVPLPQVQGRLSAVALDAPLLNLYVGTDQGQVHHVRLTTPDRAEWAGAYPAEGTDDAVTQLGFLIGDRSLVVMTRNGSVSTWVQVRDPSQPGGWALRQNHRFGPQRASVTTFSSSQRDKGFVTGDALGAAYLRHATSERTLLQLPGTGAPLVSVALAPKADGLLTYDAGGRLTLYDLHNPHPEVTWGTLFRPVWYEGYDGPAQVWQSSSGSDDFEPKLGLAPLAFGTLKGTCYALLLAIPLAILAALFTSQFMHPSLRAAIKPAIEMMAALPTVVLGFLAGLWLAPLLERLFPALVGMAVVLPTLVLLAAFLWRLCPRSFRHRFHHGAEAFWLIPLLAGGILLCLLGNDAIEQILFQGNFKVWLAQAFGLRYDQRNAVVVGIVMGMAIIPIIYSISEEALSNVPRNLVAGSLALGATRWQTVVHMVLLAASPGIFSAVMIGFGRAIGETMIVLMATGNTPIMEWNWFNGFRTLSANIAVEIPEAPHGGTLYRVLFLAALLLFVVTFAVNTVAEVVRQRLKSRHGHA